MNRLFVLIVACLTGCSATGTCISQLEDRDLCMLAYPKSACAKLTSSEFFPEEKSAGLLRCKSLGFESGDRPETLFKRK